MIIRNSAGFIKMHSILLIKLFFSMFIFKIKKMRCHKNDREIICKF